MVRKGAKKSRALLSHGGERETVPPRVTRARAQVGSATVVQQTDEVENTPNQTESSFQEEATSAKKSCVFSNAEGETVQKPAPVPRAQPQAPNVFEPTRDAHTQIERSYQREGARGRWEDRARPRSRWNGSGGLRGRGYGFRPRRGSRGRFPPFRPMNSEVALAVRNGLSQLTQGGSTDARSQPAVATMLAMESYSSAQIRTWYELTPGSAGHQDVVNATRATLMTSSPAFGTKALFIQIGGLMFGIRKCTVDQETQTENRNQKTRRKV